MEQIVYDLNIKDLTQLRPDQYDAFYKAVEALKGKE